MSTDNICFNGEIRKLLCDTPSYQEICLCTLFCFQHLSESCFCLALYTEEVNLQTFVII